MLFGSISFMNATIRLKPNFALAYNNRWFERAIIVHLKMRNPTAAGAVRAALICAGNI